MTVQCPAFELPDSALMSEQSQAILQSHRKRIKILMAEAQQNASSASPVADPREAERTQCYQSPAYQYVTDRYPVTIETDDIAGVPVEIFTPAAGIAEENRQCVLINFHGGGFVSGSRTMSRIESIPVAALGKIKVVSVDYRMAPEHRFPAATDDAFAVYCALLKDYAPNNIGIFGSSAGAHIAAQLMVRLQEEGIDLPGAIAMIASGAFRKQGDSMAIGGAIVKGTHGADLGASKDEYFIGADRTTPQVTPGLSDRFMAAFPPSLLASSTRDFALSAVVATQRRLVSLGVEADLQLWEGLDHFFHCNSPDLPESEELHKLTVAFFNKKLSQ